MPTDVNTTQAQPAPAAAPAPRPSPAWHGWVRNPQDFYGGLALFAIAVFALWAGSDLPGTRGFALGPGSAPRLFGVLLGALGIIIMVIGWFTDGPVLERYAVRGPVFITASILVFAAAIRPLGLVITSMLTILISSAATPEVRWRDTIIWAAVLTAFCSFLFPYALNLPLQLWPAWLAPYLRF